MSSLALNGFFSYLRKHWKRAYTFSPFASLLALTTTTNIGLAVAGVFTGVLSARLLGAEGRGELAAIQNYPLFLSLLAALGLSEAVAYYSAREPEQSGQWLCTAICMALLASVPVMAAGYFAMRFLLKVQSPEIIKYSQIYLLYLPASILYGLPLFLFRGRNHLVIWNLLRIWPPALWVIVLCIGFLFGNRRPSAIAINYLIGFSFLWLIAFFFINRSSVRLGVQSEKIRPLLKYGLPTVFSSVPSVINLRVDQLLIAGVLGTKTLGLYVMGVAWAGMSAPLLGALSSIMFPRVAGAEGALQKDIIAQGTRVGFFLSLIMCFIALILAPYAIPLLFGEEFRAAIVGARILSVASIFLFLNQLLSAGVLGLGKPVYVLVAELAGAVVTILMLTLLLKPFGLEGAAIASLVSYFIVSLFHCYFLRQLAQIRFKDMFLPQVSDYQVLFLRLKGRLIGAK